MLLFPGCPAKADLVFLLDSSGSVGRANFLKLQQFVLEVLDEMHIAPNHTRVGLGIYSTNAKISFYLDQVTNYDEAKDAILSTPYIYGDTNTADALKMMRERLFRSVNLNYKFSLQLIYIYGM